MEIEILSTLLKRPNNDKEMSIIIRVCSLFEMKYIYVTTFGINLTLLKYLTRTKWLRHGVFNQNYSKSTAMRIVLEYVSNLDINCIAM